MTLIASVIVNDNTPAPTTTVQRTNGTYGPISALAAVHLGDLTVQTSRDSARFRTIAAAFIEAADLMDATNAEIAAERCCSDCGKALHDEDLSNTGLGHHVDCTVDGALAGQPA